MLNHTTACLLVILLSLTGLMGCQAPPELSAPSPVSLTPDFYTFVVRYYAQEQAELRNAYADKPLENDMQWEVTIRIKQVRLRDATHGVVVYIVSERWEGGTWGAEAIQPAEAQWEHRSGRWRLMDTRKGRSIKSYWGEPDA